MNRLGPLPTSSRTQPCDLCGGQEFELIDRSDRRSEQLATVICHRCGLVAHEAIPTDEQMAEYYATQYRQDYHGEITPSAHRILRAWEGAHWLLKCLKPYVPTGGRVCEIGAGIGCTVKAFELAGFRSSGIEPGVGFQRYAQHVLGADVTEGSLLEMPAEPSFDFILLVHVIEHFNSPRRALTHIRSLLRPGGRLYLECPNLGAPHAAPGKQFHYAHIHNFTPDTLEMLAESCGLRIHTCLHDENSKSLRYLLEADNATTWTLRPGSYAATRRSLERYSWLTYHLRLAYWQERCHRDLRFLSQHIFPTLRVQSIVRGCQSLAAA